VSLLDRADGALATFATSLSQHGDRLAVASRNQSLTYAQLADRVDDAADRLGGGRRLVMVAAANDVESLVGYLAALRAGHPVLLVPGDRADHVARVTAAFDPDVLIAEQGSGWETTARRSGSAHTLHPDLALLLCTSGTTGSSRLVRLSHRNLQANATAIAGYLGLTEADRAVTSLPMHYCYGLSVINSHLASGAGIVLTDTSVVDRCFWDLFRQHGATSLAGVPHTFDLLDRVGFDRMSLPTLRYVTQAGGRLSPDRVRHYAELGERDGWELFVMYGQTEATARMAYLPPSLARSNPHAIGVPIPGGAFEIEPADGAGDPDVGELVYRGENVMLGYADEPGDLALGATVDALRTGDLARRHDDGLYELVGRRSQFAKIFGLRIDLRHVEDLLSLHAIAALCTSDDDMLLIGVTNAEDGDAARRLVQAECGLPPSRLEAVLVDDLPRLANGKPGYLAVRQAARGGSHPTDPTDPSDAADSDIDPVVRRAFATVLQRSDLTGASTFVSLGGDSLSYVEMSIALEEVLGELPVDWPTTPLRDLVRGRRPSRFVTLTETSVVLRAVAIVLVVGTHINLFNLLGGAHLLLGIAGYNFTRFQLRAGDTARSIARIAVPAMVWLSIASFSDDRIHLDHVLLVHGWIGDPDAHGGYWFVETLVQILVPLAALLAIPAVRRIERAHRFGFAMGVVSVGLLVRFHVIDVPTVEPHDIRPHDVLWLFAIGWAAAQARTTGHRLLLSGLLVLAVPGYFGEPQREVFVVLGFLLLIWVPTLALVRPATRIVGSVASASLYIYLTHWQVFPPLVEHFGPEVALVGSVGAGIVAWSVSRRIMRLAGRGVDAQRVAKSGGPTTTASARPSTGETAPAKLTAGPPA